MPRLLSLFALALVALAPVRAAYADPALPAAPPGWALAAHALTPSAETVRAGGAEWPAHFQGTFTYVKEETYAGNSPHTPWCQEGTETATGQLRLDFAGTTSWGAVKYLSAEGSWSVSGGCQGTHTWTEVVRDEEVACTWNVTRSYSGSGAFPGEDGEVSLFLYGGAGAGPAELFYGFLGETAYHNDVECPGSGWEIFDDEGTTFGFFTSGVGDDQLARGTWVGEGEAMQVTLGGSSHYTTGQPPVVRVFDATWGGGFGPRVLELVIEPLGYADWTPAAGPDELAPGNGIAVRARLQYTDGGPSEIEAVRFAFALEDVSREPGTALNRPLHAPFASPDLQFDPGQNPGQTITSEGQYLETAEGGTEWTATVSAYDWGAWGAVRATADMGDGWTLTGRWIDDPAQQAVRLPKRAPDSRIADAWKEWTGAAGLADDDDAEGQPAGDGHAGDGLTLYEEYRGFYENGLHRSADPLRKDLFVFDELGGHTKRAIALFRAATGLAVHHRFQAEEYGADRVVNRNHGAGPHLGDQHGVRLVGVAEERGYAQAVGGPGVPRQVTAIEIPPNLVPGGSYGITPAYYAATVAHELGHAVNVWHHGETDRNDVRWTVETDAFGRYVRDDAGHLLVNEDGFGAIQLLSEAGLPFATRRLQERGETTVSHLGVAGGQHSGSDRCFMRYDVSTASVGADDPAVRYYTGDGEPVGTGLCASAEGTGVNAPGRDPQPRYGGATRGNCTAQLCVNDRHTH